MRALLPRSWRGEARHLLRKVHDLAEGQTFLIAKRSTVRLEMGRGFPEQLSQLQPIRRTEFWENKIYNLNLASKRIENVALLPGEIFSFWSLVGRPSKRNGFREGRSIVEGQLNTSVGGGLCQLSGLLYSIALQAGLEIRERHSHSIDLYDDITRFAPLGSDATVTYGYKDLRLRNKLNYPICFRPSVREETLQVILCAKELITEYAIQHPILARDKKMIKVETLRIDSQGITESLGISHYRCC